MTNSRVVGMLASSIAILLLAAPTLSAAPLTMEQAVEQAVDRHPAIRAAEGGTEAAVEVMGQAESAWWPRLQLTSSYRFNQPVPELSVDTGFTPPGSSEPLAISNEIGTAHQADVTLQAGWRALDWGVRSAQIEAAESALRATQQDERLRAVDIAYAVRVAYLASVFFDSAVELTRGSLETARRQLEDREIRLRAGLGAELDVASARSQVAELEARLVDLRSEGERARETLRLLLGLDREASLELVDGLDDLVVSARDGDTEMPTEIRLAALSEALDYRADAIDRSFWPTLDVFARVAYQYPATFVDVDEAGFAWTVGASLNWELFDGGLRHHREQELRAQARATDQAREAADEDSERAVIDAQSRLSASEALLEAAERQIETAESYLRVAEAAYEAGARTSLDVLAAQSAVDLAQLSALQARLQRGMARADLLRAHERIDSDSDELSSDRGHLERGTP